MRSAPHVLFSTDIWRMRAMVSAGILDPEDGGLDFRRQMMRYNSRCQRNSVSGCTMSRACLQYGVTRASRSSLIRSNPVSLGRFLWRWRMMSC